jgi:hypothetical protein
MSGVHQTEEQNEEILALLREHNDLLRERLPVIEAPSGARREPQEAGNPPSD